MPAGDGVKVVVGRKGEAARVGQRLAWSVMTARACNFLIFHHLNNT